MSNFILDGTPLPTPKTDLIPVPVGADLTKYINAANWNTVCQGLIDARTELTAGMYHGLTPQVADPVITYPALSTATYIWMGTDGQLRLHRSDGTTTFLTGDSGVQQALTVSSNLVAWDGSAGVKANVTLTANATISAMTNAIVNATYTLNITGQSGHTLSWDTSYDFGSALPPQTPISTQVLTVTMYCTAGGGSPHLRCVVLGGGFSS